MIFLLLKVLTCLVCAVPISLNSGIHLASVPSAPVHLKDIPKGGIPEGYDIQGDKTKQTELVTGYGQWRLDRAKDAAKFNNTRDKESFINQAHKWFFDQVSNTSSKKNLLKLQGCVDTPGWIDSYGDTCAYYINEWRCEYYKSEGTRTHCCLCGGGSTETVSLGEVLYNDLLGRGPHYLEEEEDSSIGLTGGNFCGLPEDVIDNYLTPPPIVQDFISFAFGASFGIGKLKDHDSESCGEIAALIGDDLDVAWINIDTPDMDALTEAADENHEKCKKRQGSANNCKKRELATLTDEDEADEGEIFPICAAMRPCAADNTKLLQEGTFAIHFAGDGLPIAQVYGISLGIVSLAFSSTGDLKTDALLGDPDDDDTLTLLDVVPHESLGMHLYVKGSVSFPVCKIKGKEVLTMSGTLGVGIFGMITLHSGQKIKSPSELIVYFLKMGGDLEQMTNQENAIKALDFELNGAVDGEIGIDLENLWPKSNLGSLTFQVQDRLLIQLHVEQHANSLQIWNSFRVSTDLKDLLAVVPLFADLVPSLAIQVENKVYVGVKEPYETDFILSFEASVTIDCGPLDDIVKLFIGVLEGIFQQDLEDLRWFVDRICSADISVGFQIRKKEWGIDPEETFLSFQDHKLRLSHLPICYKPENGVKPSSHSIESAHSSSESKCSSNDDCTYNGVSGYCLNHPQLRTVAFCQGRCVQKIPSGGSCSDQRLNLLVEAINPLEAEHAACESNQCWRGVCTTIINGKNLMADGGPCGGKGECHSGWCEGSTVEVAGGNGVCRAKRANGQPSWHDWQESCQSGKSQCGTCTANYEDLANGKSCSGAAQCLSHWCEGHGGTGCWGTCQPRRANGQPAWNDWQASCQSGKSQCGTCTANYQDLANGKRCSGWAQCASDWCQGHGGTGCWGTCAAKVGNNRKAWGGYGSSCHSNYAQCGYCVDRHRRMEWKAQLNSCVYDSDCYNGRCWNDYGGGWGYDTYNCKGECY